MIKHLAHGGAEVFALHDLAGLDAEAVGDLDEIRIEAGRVIGRADIGGVAQDGVAAGAGVEAVFPLHDHAEVLVVEDEDLGVDLLDLHAREFLDVHQERAVAIDVDDLDVRIRDLGADGGREAEAHGAGTQRADEAARFVEAVILRGPHLVLADASGDDGLTLGFFEEDFDGFLREDVLGLALVAERIRVLFLPAVDGLVPLLQVRLLEALLGERDHAAERVLDVGVDRVVRELVLLVLGAVDVDVDDRGVRGELLDRAGDAVVETRAHGDEEVALADGPVAGDGAVHAVPVKGLRMVAGEGAEAHQRGRDGDAGGFSEGAELLVGVAGKDAAADVERRLLGLLDEAQDLLEFAVGALRRRRQTGDGNVVGILREDRDPLVLLDVLRDVDDHGARTAGGSDLEGLVHDARQLVVIEDEEGVLHDRQGHAVEVGFLEGSATDELLVDLASDADQRDAVHVRIGDRSDEIRGARAGGRHADTGLAGRTGVTVGHEGAALLVARQDGADFLGADEAMVELHRGAAWVSKDRVDAEVLEAADHDITAAHFDAGLGRDGRGGGGGGLLSGVLFGHGLRGQVEPAGNGLEKEAG